MLSTTAAVAVAATWLWLGMVLAISFLEAPLKFRAPGVDLRTGLAIGRVVFRALNAVEAVLAAVVLILVSVTTVATGGEALAVAAVVVLALQLVGVRPALTRRSNAVLAATTGADAPRSRAHLWYVALELIKVGVLVALGVVLLHG